jgi:hypothetical protein
MNAVETTHAAALRPGDASAIGLRYVALPTAIARHYQAGGADANGQAPEVAVSDGDGVPCRHCLQQVTAGERYLILAHRPFPAPQPYAELGPIFLHAEPCERHADVGLPPAEVLQSARYLIRGYSANDRIVYGSGQVVPTADLPQAAAALLALPQIAYVHVRSASNNCYQFRIERAASAAAGTPAKAFVAGP